MRKTFVCLGSLLVLAGGCGGTREPAATEVRTATVVATDPLEGLREAPNISTLNVEAALAEAAARPPVIVPDVVGLRLDVAEDEVENLGLSWEVIGGGTFGVVSDSAWTVCSQKPYAGKKDKNVELVVARPGEC